MAHGANVLRELDPAERYYWLLSRLSATNIVALAELDRLLPHDALTAGLAAVQRHHPLLRASIDEVDARPVFVGTDEHLPLTVTTAQGPGWISLVERELDTPFAPAPSPLARCVYVALEGEERALLLLTVHHAMADAKAAVAALQQILRTIERDTTNNWSAPLPPPLHESFPPAWRSARGALEVLQAVRAEREDYQPVETIAFHDRKAIGQNSRLDSLTIDAEQTNALLAKARADGATVQGELGAAVLEASAALFDPPGDRLLYLATPTDLRQRVEPPIPGDAVTLAIGLLCTPYLTSAGHSSDLARQITEQTHRELDRGESHLFYRFARAGSFPATDDGVTAFAATIDEAPPNIAVSNLGVVAHEGDPEWVRSLSFSLSTTSNQLAFVAATTYRGQMTLNIATDQTKLSVQVADRLTQGIRERLFLKP